MRKQRTEYDSPIDVLVLLAKRLSAFEGKYGMESEDFFDRFSKGQMEDSVDFTEWANDYETGILSGPADYKLCDQGFHLNIT